MISFDASFAGFLCTGYIKVQEPDGQTWSIKNSISLKQKQIKIFKVKLAGPLIPASELGFPGMPGEGKVQYD